MSFLSSIYSKLGLSSSSRTKRAEHWGETPDQYPHFVEEIDPEIDGFVLLTDSKSKRCKTIAHEFHENVEHIRVQQAASCPGLRLPCAREGLVTREKPSQQKDFVTAADLPFKFSKPLQLLFKMSLDKTQLQSLNIEQYDYDFSLERTVLALYDNGPLSE